jgi:hypothetical protein
MEETTANKSLSVENQYKDNKNSITDLYPDWEDEIFTPEKITDHIQDLKNKTKEDHERKVNQFPVEVFPLAIQQIIIATNENLNFPIDFIGASMLYAASVSIGNTFRAEVKKGFQESAVLYLALVARAGTNKSHPLSFALQPIIEHDKRTYQEYQLERQAYEKTLSQSKKDREQQGKDEPKKPIWEKFIFQIIRPKH